MLLSVSLRTCFGRRFSVCWFALAAGWLPAAHGVAADAVAVASSEAAAVAARVADLGGKVAQAADGSLTGITISDGGGVTADDLRLFGDLPGLQTLAILNCRTIDDAALEALGTRAPLRTLAITNSAVTDAGAMGALAMGGVACGSFRDLRAATQDLVPIEQVFEPDPTYASIADARFSQFCELYQATAPISAALLNES